MPRTFEYLLNAMEAAAQEQKPAEHEYGEKRRRVFQYVQDLFSNHQRRNDDATAASVLVRELEHQLADANLKLDYVRHALKEDYDKIIELRSMRLAAPTNAATQGQERNAETTALQVAPAVAAPSAGTPRTDRLRAILCDADGLPCFAGSSTDRLEAQLALMDLDRLERELADKEEALSEAGDRLLGWRKRALKAEAAQSATQPTAGVELLREWQTLYKEILANFLPQARTTQGGLAARTDEFLAAVGGKSDG